jgi:hypothetical protein
MRQFHWVTHSKNLCNYSTHKFFSVLASHWLVAASNTGHSPSSGFPNYPLPNSQLLTSHFSLLTTTTLDWLNHNCPSPSHIATDDESVSKSWYRAPSWGPWPDIFFLLIWKLLSCSIGAPSLTRGRVCHLSVIVRISKSIVSTHIYLQI